MNKRILLKTFRNTIGAAAYVFFVSQILNNGSMIFGKNNAALANAIAPFVFLMLFCLSAAIVGGLVFGPSVILFLHKKNGQGFCYALYSVGWLALYSFIGLVVLALI